MDLTNIDPAVGAALVELGSSLSTLLLKGTTTAVQGKIASLKNEKSLDTVRNSYDEMIMELMESYFDEVGQIIKKYSQNDSVLSLLEELKGYMVKDKYRQFVISDSNVFLYTYHGSKGLEFDRVFCIDVNETIVPNLSQNDMVEEERRMFYVALTRAKEALYICSIKKRGKKNLSPSRFINEMKDDGLPSR